MRNLVLILGDQLTLTNPALHDFDPRCDGIAMIEARSEGDYVWSHRARIALFLSAMRHFAIVLRARDWPLFYLDIEAPGPADFAARLRELLITHQPEQLRVCEPGEWRMLTLLQQTCAATSVPLNLFDDTHFLCSRSDFAQWAGRKELRMEYFYRMLRKRHRVLLQADGEPEGGQWNYDADNRKGFPKTGPGAIPPPASFAPDAITQAVCAIVEREFAEHPGSLAHFAWPVTREQALIALQRFIDDRLVGFGPYQDAMWTDTPHGWHALISTSLNLHLLDPREVIAAAESAYRAGRAPLASVEGFIRQVLGWREFIRGVYWLDMPGLRDANHYQHHRDLPAWYWTGRTHMRCMRAVVEQTLAHG